MGVGFTELLVGLLILLVVFVVFLVLRGFFCWYWKINRILALLEKIEAKLPADDEQLAPGVTNSE